MFFSAMAIPMLFLCPPPQRRITSISSKRKKEISLEREERRIVDKWRKKEEKRKVKKAAEKTSRNKAPQREEQRRDDKAPSREEAQRRQEDEQREEPKDVRLRRRLKFDNLKPAVFLGGFDDVKKLSMRPRPEVAFLGRSNVGKSSLLNALLAERKNVAITGQRPGRTRRINIFEIADLRGSTCYFADLPGYGFAKLQQEEQDAISAFVQNYLDSRTHLRCLVFLVDARRDPNDEDAYLLNQFRKRSINVLVVATKIDKLASGADLIQKLDAFNQAYELPPDQPLYFSAVTRQGRNDLWAAINDAISLSPSPSSSSSGVADDDSDDDLEEDDWPDAGGNAWNDDPPPPPMDDPDEEVLTFK